MHEAEISIDGPFDLRRTVSALGVGTLDEDGVWWWATPTASGSATVAITTAPGGVWARAWGEGGAELLDRVPRLVSSKEHADLVPAHDSMREFLAKTRGLRLGSTGAVHETIGASVLGQVVTKTEGKRSLRSLVTSFGAPAPGPRSDLTMFPAAEVLAALTYDDLHSHGLERRRASVLIEVSRRAHRLEEILDLRVEDAERRLLAVRGIGPWTAGIVMGQAYGDKDALPIGDYHLPNMVAWALAGEPRADDARMVDLLEPYRPYRRHALVAIKQSGVSAPKYGPRTAVRDHL